MSKKGRSKKSDSMRGRNNPPVSRLSRHTLNQLSTIERALKHDVIKSAPPQVKRSVNNRINTASRSLKNKIQNKPLKPRKSFNSYSAQTLADNYSTALELHHKNVCKTRKERKRVIFAKGKAGSGSARPTYTFNSKVRC